MKQIAQRAAWLGNDEAHYFEKWTSKDTEDLKQNTTSESSFDVAPYT